ncbi:MAG: insulinase family protein [Endomicrobium sp.]|jgi:predicted Zn-dependent peptidase|nr:insulinase family protein [Endomicrobium sp.]
MISSFILKNDIKVIFSKTYEVDVVALKVFTPVSVINESLDNAGISYITSRLMTRSTKNRSNEILASDIEDIGAQLYSFVDYDISGIGMIFLCKYFNRAVEILSDIILNPTFHDTELSFEKENIIASLNSRKDIIGRVVYDEFIKLFYHKTPYAMPVLGTIKTVQKMNFKSLEQWYKYSYNSSNILISVAGNVDKNIVKKYIGKYFSLVHNGLKFKTPIFNIKHSKPIKKKIYSKFNQSYIYLGFPAPSIYDIDFISIKVANIILGGKMSSRLFIELRENLGLAYEVGTIYPSRREMSYFAIYIGLDKENIDLALNKINKILKDFYTLGVLEQELKDAKMYIKGLHAMNKQTVNNQSHYYGWLEIIGKGHEYDTKYLKDIDKISTKNISDAIGKLFSKDSTTIIISPHLK